MQLASITSFDNCQCRTLPWLINRVTLAYYYLHLTGAPIFIFLTVGTCANDTHHENQYFGYGGHLLVVVVIVVVVVVMVVEWMALSPALGWRKIY